MARAPSRVREGPLVWLHGASVGEMLSVLPLIECIRARDITVLVTAGTVTAAELAKRRLPPGVIHQFVPIDMPQYRRALPRSLAAEPRAVRGIRSMAQPDHGWRGPRHSDDPDQWAGVGALVPALAARCRARSRALLSCFDLCLAQSAEDAARYAELGAPRYITTGNLKGDVPAPPADATKLRQLQSAIGRAAGDRRRFHASRRGDRTDRRASKAASTAFQVC